MIKPLVTILLGLLLSASATAAGSLAVEDAWVRESIPGQHRTVGYLRLANLGERDCTLREVTASGIPRVEIHEHRHHQGAMQMRRVPSVTVAAGDTLTFAPGGLHLMLLELPGPLAEGQSITLNFLTEECGDVASVFPVERVR